MAHKIIHKHSNVVNTTTIDNVQTTVAKLPTSEQLDYGEIAINYAKDHETISIKNNNNEVVEFRTSDYILDTVTANFDELADIVEENERVAAQGLVEVKNDIENIVEAIEVSNTIVSGLTTEIENLKVEIENDEKVISQSIANIENTIIENEEVVATDLNNIGIEINNINTKIEGLGEVVGESLTDLNDRMQTVENKYSKYEKDISQDSDVSIRDYLNEANNIHLFGNFVKEFTTFFSIGSITDTLCSKTHTYLNKDELTGIEHYRSIHEDGLFDVSFIKTNYFNLGINYYDDIKGYIKEESTINFKQGQYSSSPLFIQVNGLSLGTGGTTFKYFTQAPYNVKPNMYYVCGTGLFKVYG